MGRREKDADANPRCSASRPSIPPLGSWDGHEGYSVLFDKLHKQRAGAKTTPSECWFPQDSHNIAPQQQDDQEGRAERPQAPKAIPTQAAPSRYAKTLTRDAAYPGGIADEPPPEPEKPLVEGKGTKGAKTYHVPQMGWWDGMEPQGDAPYLGSSIIFEAARTKRDGKGTETASEETPAEAKESKGCNKKGTKRPTRARANEIGRFAAWNAEEQKNQVGAGPRGEEDEDDDRVTLFSGKIPRTHSRLVIRFRWRFGLGGKRSKRTVKKRSGNSLETVPEVRSWHQGPVRADTLPSRNKVSSLGSSSKGSSRSNSISNSNSNSGSSTPEDFGSAEGSSIASPDSALRSCDALDGVPKVASEMVGSLASWRALPVGVRDAGLPPRKTRSVQGKIVSKA